jgi:hypothetical protein
LRTEKLGGHHCWSIGMAVLRDRVAITYEARAEGKASETAIQKILAELSVP